MSGLEIRFSAQAVPAAVLLESTLDPGKGTFRYHREGKEPRKLRAAGGSNWLALADHQSRLYRFEYGGKSLRLDHRLVLPAAPALGTVQILPTGEHAPVFSATYSPPAGGLVCFHWRTGEAMSWVTEGLGVWYGTGSGGLLLALLFGEVQQ